MGANLESEKLVDICTLVTDGTHDSPKLQEIGVPFIKGKHISSGRIDFEDCDFITEEDHIKCAKRVKPQMGDILFANIGSVGDVARVTEDKEFSIKNVALFRPDPKKVDPTYFYYLVVSPNFRGLFLNTRSGAAQPFISLETFRSQRITFNPDKVQQTHIGEILVHYDDLIENNRRRIVLLEQSARLLYKEWFVYLRFPGYEHVKITDGLPEGWKRGKVSDLGQVITGKTPSTKDEANYDGEIPFVKTPDMHGQLIVVKTEQRLSERGANTQANKYIPKGSVMVSCIGTVGVVSIASCSCQTNQQINSVVFDNPNLRYYSYFALSDLKPRLEGMGGGATMDNVNKTKFSGFPVVIPDNNTLTSFHDVVEASFSQIETLARHNACLSRARDLLLPRLMNGEIAV